MNRDLTVGKPDRVLWRFCLPLFGSVIFQQLYNIADSFVAGKFIGEDALAAVGNSYEITLIFIAFAFGCNIGCSVIAARLFGAKRFGELKTAVFTALIACGALIAALMALGLAFGAPLLRLIRTPEKLMADSLLYLDIYVYGLPFMFFYNVATGLFAALGDSRTPFIFLAASSTANIGADILFVAGFGMGVDGVAWATFICQGVSCAAALAALFLRLSKTHSGRVKLFSPPLLRQIAAVAVPSILQQSFISVGNIAVQSVVNSFGPSVMAGYSASIKLNSVALTSFTTMGNGISNYTAQNLGAGRRERVSGGVKAGLKIAAALAVPLAAIYFFAGRSLTLIFLDSPTGAAADAGAAFLRTVSPFYIAVAAKLVFDGVLRGAGLMKRFMAATFTDLLLRVALALVLSRPFGSAGVWMSWPTGWLVGAALSFWFYKTAFGKE